MSRSSLVLAASLALCVGCESSVEPNTSDATLRAGEVGAAAPAEVTPAPTEPQPTQTEVTPPAEASPDFNTGNQSGTGNTTVPSGGGMGTMMKFPKPEDIVFRDDVKTNVEPPKGLDGLIFIDTKGQRVQLGDYVGKKHVVLVFTEGFSKMLCPFCKTQTSRLVANYEKFARLNAEVLVVYPGARDRIDEFLEAASGVDKEDLKDVPFPVVLDPKLEAVDHFDIRSQLAHPSTYVIDIKGDIQLAYVGKDMSPDRPSIKSLLETLQRAEERN